MLIWLRALLRDRFESVGRFFTQHRYGRALAFVSLPAAVVALALWEPAYSPPIFDVQVHYNEEAWKVYSPRVILNTARKINVPWMAVSSTPNDGTFRLAGDAAVQVVPLLAPYRSAADRDDWFRNPEIVTMLEAALATGRYRGIGEFHLYDGQVDTPVVRRLVELAAEHRLVLSAHSDPNAVRQLFALAPGIRILWAHAGMTANAATVEEMLGRYPNLWAELSHRTDIAPRGRLAPEWRELLLRYPGRFLLGSGTYSNEYWQQFRYSLMRCRDWLEDLPPVVAERIAYRNALELFGVQ